MSDCCIVLLHHVGCLVHLLQALQKNLLDRYGTYIKADFFGERYEPQLPYRGSTNITALASATNVTSATSESSTTRINSTKLTVQPSKISKSKKQASKPLAKSPRVSVSKKRTVHDAVSGSRIAIPISVLRNYTTDAYRSVLALQHNFKLSLGFEEPETILDIDAGDSKVYFKVLSGEARHVRELSECIQSLSAENDQRIPSSREQGTRRGSKLLSTHYKLTDFLRKFSPLTNVDLSSARPSVLAQILTRLHKLESVKLPRYSGLFFRLAATCSIFDNFDGKVGIYWVLLEPQ